MEFISDSNLINKIIYDIFKYCNITDENRSVIIEMIEQQMESDNNIKGLILDKKLLLNGK